MKLKKWPSEDVDHKKWYDEDFEPRMVALLTELKERELPFTFLTIPKATKGTEGKHDMAVMIGWSGWAPPIIRVVESISENPILLSVIWRLGWLWSMILQNYEAHEEEHEEKKREDALSIVSRLLGIDAKDLKGGDDIPKDLGDL